MGYVIIRSDMSSVLSDENGWMVWSTFDLAEKSAKNFCGHAVPIEVAEKLVKLTPLDKSYF